MSGNACTQKTAEDGSIPTLAVKVVSEPVILGR